MKTLFHSLVVTPGAIEKMRNRFGVQFGRVKSVFDRYGPSLSYKVVDLLIRAEKQGHNKLAEILDELEDHWITNGTIDAEKLLQRLRKNLHASEPVATASTATAYNPHQNLADCINVPRRPFF